jgi:hypothetical protein
MKPLRSILGNTGAALTSFLLYGWFQRAIGAAHLRIDPTCSGGEISHVIERPGYRIVVNRPVPRRSPLQRVDPFVQVAWTPADKLPARLSDEVDLDGDGVPDVRVAIGNHPLVVDVTPLGARYRPMHSQGVTSFSALIARVKDTLVVHRGRMKARYTFCAAACLPARRPPTTHRAMPCSPNPPADSPAQ